MKKNRKGEIFMEETKRGSTKRIQELIVAMEKRAWKDRSKEWFMPEMFEDIGKEHPDKPVIIRRAMAIGEMLEAMTNAKLFDSKNPHYVIRDGELIVGVITLGSLGLGKSFPNYITGDEKGVTTITTRSEMALFGHNTVNYEDLLHKGLDKIISESEGKLEKLNLKIDHYNNLVGFCASLEKEPDRLADNFAKELETRNKKGLGINVALKVVFEEEEEALGNRHKTYDKEIGHLFTQLDVCLKKEDGQKEIALPIIKLLKKKLGDKRNILHNKRDFYNAVKISCNAVIDYARRFADLAEEMAAGEKKPERKKELHEIVKVCRKVPAKPADTFHDALQSIYFFHLALHSSMNQLSIGRLDQVIQPYYREENREKQLELLECFLIKCAERLILDSTTFLKQDHVDYGSNILTTPFALEQWAEANEFLQNIIIGGQTRAGKDAVNDCSFLILDAYRNTKLFTPTLNARIHKEHVKDSNGFLAAVAKCLAATRSGLPVIGNDEALIPAMQKYSDIPVEEARDYVIDGCWELLLNGTCDWTYRLFNLLTTLECALNGGALLSANPVTLRGQKISYKTPLPADEPAMKFAGLQEIMKQHIKFFTDQSALSIYKLYLIDQAINPTPLYSSLLKGCMENGRDKTWGGSDYRLGGVVAAGAPDAANTLAAIEKWVYKKKEFLLGDVINAFRYSYDAGGDEAKQKVYDKIKVCFQSDSPKFGNKEKEVDDIMKWMLDTFYECVQESKKLAEEIFLKPTNKDNEKRIVGLRALAGYSGLSMEEEFGKNFGIKFTTGLGTFELFDLIGGGNAASSDRTHAGDPIARNFAPQAGSTNYGVGHLLSSFKDFGLDRFASGVVTDLCLEEKDLEKEADKKIMAIIRHFVKNDGNMMTLTISDREQLAHIYELCEAHRSGDEKAGKELRKYEGVNVRVGGYQVPFITLPKIHQQKYIDRPVSPSC
jgi:pyruvate-formate lyase